MTKTKVYYKTKVGIWRCRKALKKLMYYRFVRFEHIRILYGINFGLFTFDDNYDIKVDRVYQPCMTS